MGFIHLHVHSYFSFYDGIASTEQIIGKAKELGMPAVALTDYNGVYGAIRFIKAARTAGIKPIIGAEVAVADLGKIVLLVRSQEGYFNLCTILSKALSENTLDVALRKENLPKSTKGLFALVGAGLPRERDFRNTFRFIDSYAEVFGKDQMIIELQSHGLPGDKERLEAFWRFSRARKLLSAATNNVHLLTPEDYAVHTALVRAANIVHHRKTSPRQNAEYHFKSEEEMALAFRGYEEALGNTELMARECTFDLPATTPQRGHEQSEASALLRAICERRLKEIYPTNQEEVMQRLSYELSVIEEKGFSEYFRQVADLVDFARKRRIRHSCRGSAPGSLVVYLLGISTVDPVENNLLFERFLNPERPDIPDIDIDFDSKRRDEVIQYAVDKFKGHAAMVATVSRFRGRSAIRELGRTVGLSYDELDRLAGPLGHYVPATKIREAIATLPELRGSELGTKKYEQLLDICSRINDFPRHLSVHLGGLVITREPIAGYSPIQPSHKGFPVLSFDKDDVEALGLIKTDLLGLRMLGAIEDAEMLIKSQGKSIDLENLDTTDRQVYELLRNADTVGCFQVESPGMRGLLGQLNPEKLSDIVSAISLFRPGPVQADMVTPYIARRRNRETWNYFHESLRPILEETHGVVLFQEQAIRIGHEIAGFSYGKADLMRRAMDAPGSERMMQFKKEFLDGAAGRGLGRRTAARIFDQLSTLAAFGFNKAHAASFARIVFQSAFLKVYHTAEFMIGVLNNLPGMYPERVLLHEARRFGVSILGPDINKSSADYSLENKAIRVGLRGIRNLGPAGLSEIMAERSKGPFLSFENFRRRVRMQSALLRSLILAGAFDSLTPWRKSLFLCLESPDHCIQEEDFTVREKVAHELEHLGLDLSAHAMSLFRDSLDRLGVVKSVDLKKSRDNESVTVAGIKIILHTPPTRSGIRVVFLTLEDETGLSDVAVFPAVQERFGAAAFMSDSLVVEGTMRRQNGSSSIVAKRIRSLGDALAADDTFLKRAS